MSASARMEPLWSIGDVAAYLRIPVETIRTWRKRGYGPPAHKLGRHLRYDPHAVREWARRPD